MENFFNNLRALRNQDLLRKFDTAQAKQEELKDLLEYRVDTTLRNRIVEEVKKVFTDSAPPSKEAVEELDTVLQSIAKSIETTSSVERPLARKYDEALNEATRLLEAVSRHSGEHSDILLEGFKGFVEENRPARDKVMELQRELLFLKGTINTGRAKVKMFLRDK